MEANMKMTNKMMEMMAEAQAAQAAQAAAVNPQ
jgi:hypothetical protein